MRIRPILLTLAAARAADGPLICVSAVHNPEFSSNSKNFAHWLLAHAYPLVLRLAELAPPGAADGAIWPPANATVDFAIERGGNDELRTLWRER